MKYTLISLILVALLQYAARAQRYDTIYVSFDTTVTMPNYKPFFDSVLEHLNPTYISSGVLLDKRMIPFSTPSRFIGAGTADSVVSWHIWNSLHVDIYNSFVTQFPVKFRPDTLSSHVKSYASTDVIPIGIINMDYDWIDSNALEDSLFYISNGQLYDDTSRTNSPYNSGRTFAVSFLASSSRSDTLSFIIDTSKFYLSNKNDTLISLRINFGDEDGYVTHLFDTVYRRVFATHGEHTFMMQAIFLHDTLTSRVGIEIPAQENGLRPERWSSLDVTSSRSYNEKKGECTGWVVLGCGEPVLDKPLIFLEGFDPLNDKLPDIYYKNYFKDNEETRNTSGLRPDRPHRQVFLKDDGSATTLGEELYKAGFDLIIVDFGNPFNNPDNTVSELGGGDYIQRNAYAVEDLIERVNAIKAGNIQNIIVGGSMGGLIGRYALAEMEHRSIDHESNLFVSFDAPQAGAYVPYGLLLLLRWLEAQSLPKPELFTDALDLVKSPAALQMLILNPFASRDFERLFSDVPPYDGLMQVGSYPVNLRKVSIVNGSMTACSQAITNGEQIFQWDIDDNSFKAQSWGTVKIWSLPVGPLSSNFLITSAEIYAWSIANTHPFWATSIYIDKDDYYQMGCIENSPGATNDIIRVFAMNVGPDAWTIPPGTLGYQPTISALDNMPEGSVSRNSFAQEALFSTNFDWANYKFDKIYGGAYNTYHVDMYNLVDLEEKHIMWRLLQDEAMMDNLFLQNKTIASGKAIDYEARETITGGTNVTNLFDQGPFVIASGATVNKMRAGTTISFRDGFRASGTLHAFIDPFDECEWPSAAQSSEQPSAKRASQNIEPLLIDLSVYPNPSSGDIRISYELPENGVVKLEIYDIQGNKVSALVDEFQSIGKHVLTYSLKVLSEGVYFLRMEYAGSTHSKRFIFQK